MAWGGVMSLLRVLALLVLAFLAGCFGVWRSARGRGCGSSSRSDTKPLRKPKLMPRPGPTTATQHHSRAARVRQYAVEQDTPTVRMPHLAAALEAEALLALPVDDVVIGARGRR